MKKSFMVIFAFFLIPFILHSEKITFNEDKDIIIDEIQIKGLVTVPEKDFLEMTSYGLGMVYSQYKTREDIRNLYKSGKFENIIVSMEKKDDKNVLVYEVKEVPRIGKIIISGNKEVGEGDIKSKLESDEEKKTKEGEEQKKIKELEYFNEFLLKQGIERVKKMYKEKNFYNAKVDYSFELYKDENKRGELVKIYVNIEEGPKLKVKKITATGNKVFSVDKIKGSMDTKEEGWFVSGVFDDDKFIEDLKKILKSYYQEGYVKAKINNYTYGEIDINRDKIIKNYVKMDEQTGSITIEIPIDEGIKYTVNKIEITGNEIFNSEQLLNKIDTKPGKPYDKIKFENDMNIIKSLYAGKGYIFTQIKDTYVYDDDLGTVDIGLKITEGSVAYINKIKIRGNYVTKEKVIRRELYLDEGEPFDANKIRKAQENIYNLGFFDNIMIDTEMVDIDKLNLIFEVVERKTGNIGLGAGYSTVEGLIGYIQLMQSNLFGEAKAFSADVQFGNQKKSWQLSYKDPWLFDRPISFGVGLWNTFKNTAYNNQGYDVDSYGFDLTFGRRFGLFHKVYLTYRYEQDKYSNIRSDLVSIVPEDVSQISSITPMYVFDSRDNVFDASHGFYANASLQIGGGLFGADYNYVKSNIDLRYFIPSFWRFVFALHGRIGYATGYDWGSGESVVPVSEKFYAGGTDTVRGYEERGLGPAGGGNFLIVTNLEYKLKIVERVLTAVVFYDSGNCWNNFDEVDWQNPYLPSSLGFGVRLTIPGTVMVLRLDWGYALDNSIPGGKIHFNIGNIF
ncbi:MAG: outer membrane protein assembly factor BamA [Candidatus Goldbacteria bacterium]|nr:outer membrane protein assembly factor BamA [Candidatus Goldiibacteriota bacterium]